MARGNQRDKAREKNQKDQAGQVKCPCLPCLLPSRKFLRRHANFLLQKKKNTVWGASTLRPVCLLLTNLAIRH